LDVGIRVWVVPPPLRQKPPFVTTDRLKKDIGGQNLPLAIFEMNSPGRIHRFCTVRAHADDMLSDDAGTPTFLAVT
jgi:hypothetical protein